MGRVRGPRVGGYRLVRRLGQGGAGIVFLAVSRRGRRVALKLLTDAAGEEERRRLEREGRLAARLNHPNIVRVHGFGSDGPRSFLILDLVEGCSLQERLQAGPLNSVQALALCEALARALHYAHRNGVLHRDLKPSNVLLDRSEVPLLTDFGLAKEIEVDESQDPILTLEGDVLGTPSYMAPEQALGEVHRVDHRADVYGLGATLYAMLTGHPPFQGATWLRVLTEVVHRAPTPPSQFARGLDPELEAICLRCLEKDPDRRYPSALALAEDLSACARRLRGATPRVADLTDQAETLRDSRRRGSSLLAQALGPSESDEGRPLRRGGSEESTAELPALWSRGTPIRAPRKRRTPLRPHGESERILALHTSQSEPPLLLEGEELRLKGDSAVGPVERETPSERLRRAGAGSARRYLARSRALSPGITLVLALAPLVLFVVLVGRMLYQPAPAQGPDAWPEEAVPLRDGHDSPAVPQTLAPTPGPGPESGPPR
jgi:serine/threonine protein kinase